MDSNQVRRMYKMTCILFFIFGIVYLLVGYHNMDTGWNMKANEIEIDKLGKKLGDRNYVYQTGVEQLFGSLIFFISSFVGLIIYIEK